MIFHDRTKGVVAPTYEYEVHYFDGGRIESITLEENLNGQQFLAYLISQEKATAARNVYWVVKWAGGPRALDDYGDMILKPTLSQGFSRMAGRFGGEPRTNFDETQERARMKMNEDYMLRNGVPNNVEIVR